MMKKRRILGSRIEDRGTSGRVASRGLLCPRSSLVTPRSSSRQGILLLVVLSMLTLFLLIGTAFIVSANHYRQTQKTLARITETSNSTIDQDDLLNEVINQIVRDTHNQNSSLRFHSLLRDMYGNDGFVGESFYFPDDTDPAFLTLVSKYAFAIPSNILGDVRGVTNGQIVEIAVYDSGNPNDVERPRNLFGTLTSLSRMQNYYNGRVLTWTSGPMKGQSARIVGYRFDTSAAVQNATGLEGIGILRVVAFPRADGQPLTPQLNSNTSRSPEILELADVGSGINLGPTFVVNGVPFNGTGVGFNPSAAVNTAKLTTTENYFGTPLGLALTPNSSFQNMLLNTDILNDPQLVADLRATIFDNYYFTNDQMVALGIDDLTNVDHNLRAIRLKNLIGTGGVGGSDESYDAVDFQNMLLSLTQTNPVETVLPGAPSNWPSPLPVDLGTTVIPSLHRPALVNYWDGQIAGLESEPNFLRRCLMRPAWFDHPKFTGSNPDVATIVGSFENALRLNGYDPTHADVMQYSRQLMMRSIFGPWDVDNDNDGIRDSIWVDFGAPVMENSDGRLVKPLAAILVVDMDGRLNLNAHGTQDIGSGGGRDGGNPKFARTARGRLRTSA